MLYFFIPCSNVPDNSITWSLLISTNIEIFPLSSCCFTISCLFLHQLFCLSNLSALTISGNQPKERGKWVDVIDVYISTCIYYTLKTHTPCALHFFLALHTCVFQSFLLVLSFVMKPVFKIVNFYFCKWKLTASVWHLHSFILKIMLPDILIPNQNYW